MFGFGVVLVVIVVVFVGFVVGGGIWSELLLVVFFFFLVIEFELLKEEDGVWGVEGWGIVGLGMGFVVVRVVWCFLFDILCYVRKVWSFLLCMVLMLIFLCRCLLFFCS